MSLAETVRACLAAEDIEGALDLAITAWQTTRAGVLAELVDAIDRTDPRPAFTGDYDAWRAASEVATTHRDRGALLRAISRRTPVDIYQTMVVAQAWQDPRLSREILTLLFAMPFSGRRTRDRWRDILEVARAQQDVRFVTNAERLVEGWNVGADMKTFLTNRLAEANRGLQAPVLPAGETAAIEALISTLEAPAKRESTEADLLDAIYAHPDDDGPRLVFADWLQEREDPRGVFIANQLANGRPKKAPPRLRAALLGPLAQIVGAESEFRRGFVAKAVAKFRNQHDVELHGQSAAWATVEELVNIGGASARFDQRVWAQYIGPAMINVRRATSVHAKWLLAADQPWCLEELQLSYHDLDPETFATLLASPLLPALGHVIVEGGMPAAWLQRVRQCPAHMSFWGHRGSLPERLQYARETKLQVFTLIEGNVKHDHVRDATGAFVPRT